METEIKAYELGYLLRGDLEEEKTQETSEEIRRMIEEEKGIVTYESKLQKQILSYPVKKRGTAFLGQLKFILPAEKIQSLEKSLKKMDLLRFLLNRIKQPQESGKKLPKRRAIRHPSLERIKKGIPSADEGTQIKEPLQVEEIDKKLEEILGQ